MKEYKILEGLPYMICSDGRVINLDTGKALKPRVKKSGYEEVGVRDREGKPLFFLVHRLVAEAFIPKREGANEVNHIDGNKTNNDVSNLEWMTRNENLRHAFDTGLRKDDVSAKAVIATNMENGEEMEFPSIYKASRFFGISQGNICLCCKGLRAHASGFFWRYKEDE